MSTWTEAGRSPVDPPDLACDNDMTEDNCLDFLGQTDRIEKEILSCKVSIRWTEPGRQCERVLTSRIPGGTERHLYLESAQPSFSIVRFLSVTGDGYGGQNTTSIRAPWWASEGYGVKNWGAVADLRSNAKASFKDQWRPQCFGSEGVHF